MAETLTLTTPRAPTRPTITTYTIRAIYFGWDEGLIKITLRDNVGEIVTAVYEDSAADKAESSYTADSAADKAATTLLRALNTVNLSTTSLQKRVIQRLVTDGKLPAGAVTGAPD